MKNELIEYINEYDTFAEYCIDPENDCYLVLDCRYNEKYNGLHIVANFEKPTFFSGGVVQLENGFVLPFDIDFYGTIDNYIEQINLEIVEGYLIPNNLYTGE